LYSVIHKETRNWRL